MGRLGRRRRRSRKPKEMGSNSSPESQKCRTLSLRQQGQPGRTLRPGLPFLPLRALSDPFTLSLQELPGGASGKEPRTHLPMQVKWVPSLAGSGTCPWRRAWQPTPVVLPGEAHGQRSLASHSPWGCKESATTEATAHSRSSGALLVGLVIVGLPIGRATDSHPTTWCDTGPHNWTDMPQVV